MAHNARDLSLHNTRPNSVSYLITQGLGYCCEYAFFSRYKNTEMIAARLGVTPRAVNLHKAMVRDGKLLCEGASRCLAAKSFHQPD